MQSLGTSRWFLIATIFFLPLHVSAVMVDPWFVLPPKPIGDGPDYEAIGYGLSRGYGWCTSFSDKDWRSVYENAHHAGVGLNYSVQLARFGPITPDTNRPPFLPFCIAVVYQLVPRGPIAFGIIRILLASCLSIGCAIAVAWGVAIAKRMSHAGSFFETSVGIAMIAIVYSERNLRNYATDFLTEPLALALTQAFLFIVWYGVQRGSLKWAALSGLLFAGMYYCRSIFVLWAPLVTLWLWCAYRVSLPSVGTRRLPAVYWVFVSTLVFVLFSSPWWIRNCYVLGSFHPLGTKGSTTLLGGYCEEALKSGGEWQFAPEKELRRIEEASHDLKKSTAQEIIDIELEVGRQANIQVKLWIAQNLSLMPQLMLQRAITEWNPYRGKALLLKLLALAGVVWLALYNRVALLWLLGPLAINTSIVICTYSVGGRFLVPTYGCLYILAAIGFAGGWQYIVDWSRFRFKAA